MGGEPQRRSGSDHLTFTTTHPPGWKTALVVIKASSTQAILGSIRWFGPWRRYVFVPVDGTLFDYSCMEAIQVQIRDLMAARKKR